MDTNHLDEQIAELEKQLQEAPAEQQEQEPEAKQPEEQEQQQGQDDKADAGDDGSDGDDDAASAALSEDEKKRNRAFAKQRHEAKELKDRLEAAEKARQELAERLARLEGKAESTAKPEAKPALEDQEPDADLYPEDHARWEVRQLKKELEEIKKFKAQQEQVSSFQREAAGVEALEAQYKAKTPDYDDAVQFLVEKERRLKRVFNPQATDAQLDAMIKAEKVQLFKQILSAGRNPTEVVYEIAKQDGWQPKGKAKADKHAASSNLEAVAENQRRAANIIGGSPAESSGKVTSEQIFNMSMQDLMKKPDSFWSEALKQVG